MIVADEDSLICDLAETYGIFNYRSLPVRLVATLSVGLRADSRIKMIINGYNVPFQTLLLAGVFDKMSWLVWSQSEDGRKGIHYPKSIVNKLMGNDIGSNDSVSFASGEDFHSERERILKEGGYK